MSVAGRVAVLGGGEVVLWDGEHSDLTTWEIKQFVAESACFENNAEPVDPTALRLLHHSSELSDDAFPLEEFASSPYFKILFRLEGGKGGFGSMLRALGAKKSEHGTDNIESCRTLTGRRIRHVNDEKKIAEWKAKEPERQAATEKRKQDKRDRNIAPPKHNFDHHKLAVEVHDTAQMVDAGVRAGYEASLEHSKRLLAGDGDVGGSARSAKRAKFAWDSSDSDSSADEAHAAEPAAATVKGGTRGKRAVGKAAASSGSGRGKAVVAAAAAAASITSSSGTAAAAVAAPSASQAGTSSAKAAAPSSTVPPVQTPKAARPVASVVVAEKLDLAPYDTADDLEALGLDRLKAALLAEGLKCGGTLAERASRLMSIKGLAPDAYPAALRAGGKKKKK